MYQQYFVCSCLVYLDDIIVLGRTFETSVTSFQMLRDANLKLKVKKCYFCQETLNFCDMFCRILGYRK